jgi:hypothetical protein
LLMTKATRYHATWRTVQARTGGRGWVCGEPASLQPRGPCLPHAERHFAGATLSISLMLRVRSRTRGGHVRTNSLTRNLPA